MRSRLTRPLRAKPQALALALTCLAAMRTQAGSWTEGTTDVYWSDLGDSVGIGTSDPSFPLEVSGQAKFGAGIGINANPAGSFDLQLGNGTLHLGTSGTQDIRFGGGGALSFTDGAANTMMSLQDAGSKVTAYVNGSVGIGTASPAKPLHVKDGTTHQLRLQNPDAGGGYWDIAQTDNGFTAGAGRFVLIADGAGSANAALTIVNSSGNVGIGTTSPSRKLEVNGGILADTLSLNGQIIVGEPDNLYIGNMIELDVLNDKLRLKNCQVYIDSAVTIGGVSGVKLAKVGTNLYCYDDFRVAGQVTFEGDMDVDTVDCDAVVIGDWTIEAPDYVFDEGYSLKSLDEVERHVKAEKHLPDVPSAEEMKEKGVNLAELNMTLLKKVEELTLYAIRQEKRIDELSRRLDEATQEQH